MSCVFIDLLWLTAREASCGHIFREKSLRCRKKNIHAVIVSFQYYQIFSGPVNYRYIFISFFTIFLWNDKKGEKSIFFNDGKITPQVLRVISMLFLYKAKAQNNVVRNTYFFISFLLKWKNTMAIFIQLSIFTEHI